MNLPCRGGNFKSPLELRRVARIAAGGTQPRQGRADNPGANDDDANPEVTRAQSRPAPDADLPFRPDLLREAPAEEVRVLRDARGAAGGGGDGRGGGGRRGGPGGGGGGRGGGGGGGARGGGPPGGGATNGAPPSEAAQPK